MLRIFIVLSILMSIAFAELRIQFNSPYPRLNMACENMITSIIDTVVDQQQHGKKCSIKISMYSLDNENIIRKLTTALNNGVQIKLFLDQSQYGKILENKSKKRIIESFVNLVTGNAASVCHVLGVPYNKSDSGQTRILHEKMALFSCEDNKDSEERVKKDSATEVEEGENYHSLPADIAILGSFNWTWAASNNNYENCLSI